MLKELLKNPSLKMLFSVALKDFLILFEEELERSGLDKKQIRQYLQPLKQFVKQPPVPQVLGKCVSKELSGFKYGY